ncbi:MAG: large conductance mechanosensitive channel protein MscL [Clostridia bacterium]|nr:large conductance mechanosensitive channel protein MscL [Clostridia bacterium]MBO7738310.1 large conductance mechanosensitive channel protein MscL [Clostridia bacterium]
MGKVKNFANDFKKFISQGNILDMAVGVVVGTAFKAIVSSLVADIIMPCIGYLLGDVNFTDLKWVLVKGVDEVVEEGVVVTEAVAEVAVKYGQFIQYIIDFLIIAFAMFIVVKVAMSFRNKLEEKKKAEEAAAKAAEEAAKAAIPPEPTVEEKTLKALEDIRDFVKGFKG